MSLPATFRVGYDIFEKPVPASAAQKVRRGDEHAGRRDSCARLRDKEGQFLARQRLGPDAIGTIGWLRD
jgi:hypothetical protein